MQCTAVRCITIRVPEYRRLPLDGLEKQVEGLRNNSNTDSEQEGGMACISSDTLAPSLRREQAAVLSYPELKSLSSILLPFRWHLLICDDAITLQQCRVGYCIAPGALVHTDT